MNEGTTYRSLAFWFLAGGIAGATAGLLLAPLSGKATRQLISRKTREGVGSVRNLKDRVVTRGEEIWDEAALRVGDVGSALAGNAERQPGNGSDAPSA
jgi:gas vesicle protein